MTERENRTSRPKVEGTRSLWYEGINNTADAAITRERADGKVEILLIQRLDGTWCMPGGFVDEKEYQSGDFGEAVAASRELHEESGLTTGENAAILFTKAEAVDTEAIDVKDPANDDRSKIKTRLFHRHYKFAEGQKLQTKDLKTKSPKVEENEVSAIKWATFDEAFSLPLFADQKMLITKIQNKINKNMALEIPEGLNFVEMGYIQNDGFVTDRGLDYIKDRMIGNFNKGVYGRGQLFEKMNKDGKPVFVTARKPFNKGDAYEQYLTLSDTDKVGMLTINGFNPEILKGQNGELVITYLDKKKQYEAVKVAKEGEWIVKQPGGEQQVVTQDSLDLRYEQVGTTDQFKAVGYNLVIKNPFGRPITFKPPYWGGEIQSGGPDCLFLMVYNNTTGKPVPGDVYIHEVDQFGENFTPSKSSYSQNK